MPEELLTALVPNVIGQDRGGALSRLAAVRLRMRAKLVIGNGFGMASQQNPAPGARIPEFSVVDVTFPNPMLDGVQPIEGPQPVSGMLEGFITQVFVGKDTTSIGFSLGPGIDPFLFTLYRDTDPTGREGYMRRGAILGLAVRAYIGRYRVRVSFSNGTVDLLGLLRDP